MRNTPRLRRQRGETVGGDDRVVGGNNNGILLGNLGDAGSTLRPWEARVLRLP